MNSMALRWLASLLLCTAGSTEELLDKVQVRVLDMSGAAIAHARVSLACKGDENKRDGYSDGEGLATFLTLPSANCTATVLADKFEPHVENMELKKDLTVVDIQLEPL